MKRLCPYLEFMNSVNTHVTGTFGVNLLEEIPFLCFNFDGNATGMPAVRFFQLNSH